MARTVEFDHIAPVYDETRKPPSEAEVELLVEMLTGCGTVLDAGVGTGRFAVPLQAHGFRIVGADLSTGMMTRAHGKGIVNLVRADLRHLPFTARALDGAFMAHVLQLIPEPRTVLAELGRVARHVVVILLPHWAERDGGGEWHRIRERYRELATELGYPRPARPQRYRHSLDDLKAIATPTVIREFSASPSSPSDLGDRLARWESRTPLEAPLPPEIHAEIVRRIQAELPANSTDRGRPRQEWFIAWDPKDLWRVGTPEE
jgi:SAM-dependent methyltransferase